MIILGITGLVSSGKSTLSQRVSYKFKYPFVSMDTIVSDLLKKDKGIVERVLSFFPEVKDFKTNTINKAKLREIVFKEPQKLHKLESILHPHVKKKRDDLIKRAKRNKFKGIIFEIPLLFEVGAEREVDAIILIDVPPFIQKERFLKRPGMQVKYLESIENRLFPISFKKKQASIIIKNGLSLGNAISKISNYIRKLEKKKRVSKGYFLQRSRKQNQKLTLFLAQNIKREDVRIEKNFKLDPTRYGDWEKNGRAIDF